MVTKKIKGLSAKEIKLISNFELKKVSIVTTKEVKKILKGSKQEAYDLIYRLKKKGRLVQIKRGKYILIPVKAVDMCWGENPFKMAGEFRQPYYISYRTALNFYGLTEQVPVTIYVACLKYHKSAQVFNENFKFIQLNKNKFFGYEKREIDKKEVYFADLEKTLIDCLDKQYCGGSIVDVVKGLFWARKEIKINKLVDYSLKMDNKTLIKRLGYLLELLGIKFNQKNLLRQFKNDKKFVPLSTAHPNKGKLNKKWKIIINIPDNQLLSWKEGY